MRLVCIYDDDGLLWADDYNGYKCSGSGNGATSEMCGGCVACLMKQAQHSGLRVEMGFKIGDKVRTVAIENPPTDWTPEVAACRCFGIEGMVVDELHTGHGVCYGVDHDHDQSTAYYEARELEPVQCIATVGDLIDALWGFPRSAPIQIRYEEYATRSIQLVRGVENGVEIEAENN